MPFPQGEGKRGGLCSITRLFSREIIFNNKIRQSSTFSLVKTAKLLVIMVGVEDGRVEIYLEDAIIENFLLDGALLYLALSAARQEIVWWRLALGGVAGAAFAVLFPFLPFPPWLTYTVKLLTGGLLVFIALKRQKKRGRYALTLILFYGFSFCFGGGLVAILEGFQLPYYWAVGGGVLTKIPVGGLITAVAIFVGLIRWGIAKIYERKRACAHIVCCEVVCGQTRCKLKGLVDTGNQATCEGKAVCFAPPDLLYRLFGMSPPCRYITVSTVSGERRIGLFAVEEILVLVGGERKRLEGAYLSGSVHMSGKEYQLLLPPLE